MKKFFTCLVVVAIFALAHTPVGAEENSEVQKTNPVEQFTGNLWQKSTEDEKKAFLFGIDTAVAIEYFISKESVTKSAKKGKKPVYTLSPFEKAWMKAFQNVSRTELAGMVSEWYEKNPEELSKPVLEVIWYQIIQPRLKAGE